MTNGAAGGGKLPASSVAGFAVAIINLAIGCLKAGIDVTGSRPVDLAVYASLLLNIASFFYFAAFTEIDPNQQAMLQGVRWRKLEWGIRIINQTLVSFVIFFFVEGKTILFFVSFVGTYVGFLIWDWVVYGLFITLIWRRVKSWCGARWAKVRGRDSKPPSEVFPPVVFYDTLGLIVAILLGLGVLAEKVSRNENLSMSVEQLKSVRIFIQNHLPDPVLTGFLAAVLVMAQLCLTFFALRKTKFKIWLYFHVNRIA